MNRDHSPHPLTSSSPHPLPRRAFLRAAGVALALPALERFAPRVRAAADGPIRRMICLNTTLGIYPQYFFPEQTGRDYTSTPYLDVLKEFRNDTTIFSGVSHPAVDGGHASEASFLTGAPHPGGSSFRNSISLDQLAVEKLGADTRFGSLQLTTSSGNESQSYNRSGVMLPADNKPSVLFQKLFLNGTPQEVRRQVERLRDGQSILDLLIGQTKKLRDGVGAHDRERLDQYFESVREVETRLHKAEDWAVRPKPQVAMQPPVDIPNAADVIGRTNLLFDLIHLALENDSTRFITVRLQGHNSLPPIAGISQDWHNLSHHGKDPEKVSQLKLIEEAQLQSLRSLLAKLKGTQERGASLLDRTMVLYGSNLGNAASHDTKNMPLMLCGGGFKHGSHLAFDKVNNAPIAKIFVAMLQRLGLETDRFQGIEGTLSGLELA